MLQPASSSWRRGCYASPIAPLAGAIPSPVWILNFAAMLETTVGTVARQVTLGSTVQKGNVARKWIVEPDIFILLHLKNNSNGVFQIGVIQQRLARYGARAGVESTGQLVRMVTDSKTASPPPRIGFATLEILVATCSWI